MKKRTADQSAFLTRRVVIGFTSCAISLLVPVALMLHSGGSAFAAPKQKQKQSEEPALAEERANAPDDTQAEAPTPMLGNYADTSVNLSGNATIGPSTAPDNTTSITVSTNTNFKGVLIASPTTGVVRVTDAHPVGIYHVTLTAFGPGGTATKSFNLTVPSNPCGTVSGFDNVASVSVGSNPRSIAIGDFNGDGNQDFAVPIWSFGTGTTVSIRLGNGSGGFFSASNVNVGSAPISVAIGDFNGDGHQDLAVANDNSGTVSIRLGNGSGGFSGTTNVTVGSHPLSIAVGDFNGDGKQDFATANHDSNSVSIRLGDGLGGFSGSTNISVGDTPFSVVVGDFNGDGNQDFAVANTGSNTISIRLGDGAGGFSGTTGVSVGSSTYSLAIGDFNGDGKQDLAAPSNSSDRVFIRLGDGLGGFSGSTEVPVSSGPYGIAVGDFNGDGHQDFAVATFFTGAVSICLGDGFGGFSGATNVGVGSGAEAVAVGDFNGDGRQDMAVGGSGVSILLGTCLVSTPTPTPCVGCTPAPTPPSACETFSNSIPIAISSGNASPYPSNITVSGVGGAITNVTVALNGLSHTFPGTLDILLVGPDGQYATILSDVGDHIAVTSVDLVLDDSASSSLPGNGSLVSGIFRPTNFDVPACIFGGTVIDPFPSPAPYVSSTNSALSTFAGINPNGIWSLYVVNYAGTGSLSAGWSITISTDNCAGPTPTPQPTPTPGATYFFVTAPNYISPGESFQFTVTARDRFNNTATDYSGTIHFTTSEPCCLWSLPPDGGLTNGMGTFTVIFPLSADSNATGERPLKVPWSSAITATDAVDPLITGTSNCINTIFPSPCPSCNTPTPTPVPTPPTAPQTVTLPIASLDVSSPASTVILQPVTTTNITTAENYTRFFGDFTFDSSVVDFSPPFAVADGLTATGWTVSSQYVAIGPGTLKTITISGVADNGVPALSGVGNLFVLRMVRVSEMAGASTQLSWGPPYGRYFAFRNPMFQTYLPTQPNGVITVAAAPTPTPTPAILPVRLLNLSTRLHVGAGNDVGIGGFIITGTGARQVLLRGIGPSLGAIGLANPLVDPVLELHGTGGFSTVSNDNWRETQETEIMATGIAPTNDLESAILVTLDPGAYTAILKGNNDGIGVGLVEIYDLSQTSSSKLVNLSTRALVGTGNDIVISGFILSGGSSDDAITIRGLGPSLSGTGIPDVLPDPMLQLRDSNGALVASNDNWQDGLPPGPPIPPTGGLDPMDPLESQIQITLSPGAYTALLSGVNDGTGVGLIEVYDLGAP